MALPEDGSLSERPLPRLVLDLHREGFSGRLVLEGGPRPASIDWKQGQPVAVDGADEARVPSLTALLIEGGALEPTAEQKVAAAREKNQCSEEVAIAGLKLASPKALVLALRARIERRLAALLAQTQGSFRLEPSDARVDVTDALGIDPAPVVLVALPEIWRPHQPLAELEPRLQLFPQQPEGFASLCARLGTTPEVRSALDLLDGEHTLWALIGSPNAAERVAVAWVLDVLELCPYTTAPPSEEPVLDAPQPSRYELDTEIEIVSRTADDAASVGSAESQDTSAEDDRAAKLREEIRTRHEELPDLDHYALLGVTRDDGAGKIKRAYLKIAKRLHPDTLARLPLEDVKKEANELFAAVTRAYETLGDDDRRADYDAGLDGHAQIDANALAQAETLYLKGEMLMRAGNFTGAHSFVEAAVDLWPEEAAYQSALGWVLYKKNPPEDARACEHLGKAVALDDDDAVTHYRLGIVLKALGHADRAAEEMARAKEIDPNVKG